MDLLRYKTDLKIFIRILLGSYLLLYFNLTFPNPLNDIDLMDKNGLYNFFVEIPAGTKEKWEVNKSSGLLELEKRDNGEKRIIKFLPYPGNYGFLPQTLAGDGDAIDVIDLESFVKRGNISKIHIIGGMYFKDKKEDDVKLIGIDPNGVFKDIKNIDQLLLIKPDALEILRAWFKSYKNPGKMVFYKYLNKNESEEIIEEGHKKWKSLLNKK